ncbi:DUF3617 domain-containing protein [Sphingomonas sp. 28-63-12]|uniref:DUF3617 domain-containing protein n=1 Tax=Sphingomonas sp. 28-63-12 TaxID=1970434 RepID=UPI000BD887AC|nr:MAG: hypothetical protein B7Y47_14550 [Sphingomonas sp. 28-63-12]
MRLGNWARPAVAGVFFCASATVVASPAAAPAVAVFGQIEPGQWQLREADSTALPRLICISDPDSLVQFQHPGMQCSRVVLQDQPRAATVNYTCPGVGNGRTTIRIETPKSFHLDTQGIASGAPFEMAFEARRMGPCSSAGR